MAVVKEMGLCHRPFDLVRLDEVLLGAAEGDDAAHQYRQHGAAPTAKRANADQAAAIDLASVIALANDLRAALVEKGLIKGGS